MTMLQELFSVGVLIPWLLSMVFGIFVGAVPGLTATMAVALIVPVSYYMENANAGLAMIIGVTFTAIFAGDIPATFLKIPGTPASAAATLDGYPLTRKGKGGLALTLDLFCSCIGGLIGVGLLIFLSPQLARIAIKFSSFEYFWLAIFGLTMSAAVSSGTLVRGLTAAAFGMLLSTVGIDIVSGSSRYTFGNVEMMSGLQFIPVMIGLFGLAEVLRNLRVKEAMDVPTLSGDTGFAAWAAAKILFQHKWTVLKSSFLGTLVGALPGAGADIAAWAAYGIAKKTSKNPDEFGKGAVEGIVAPTSANNAALGGAWIPALVFGIPGDAVTAIVLGAMMVYEIKPGPFIFENSPDQVRAIFTIALMTQVFLLFAGFLGIKAFSRILRLPRSIIMTGVVLFSVVGSYSLRNSMFDVYVMLTFGVVGFFMDSHKVPPAPLILGLILGPMVEEKYRIGLIKSGGNILPFFNRPICMLLIFLLFLTFFGNPIYKWVRERKVSSMPDA